MVPGLHWLAILLVGHTSSQDPIQLASMQWWSSRGPRAWAKRDEEARALVQVAACWGQAVLHIAGSRHGSGRVFLGLLLAYALRFVQRWPVFLAPVR